LSSFQSNVKHKQISVNLSNIEFNTGPFIALLIVIHGQTDRRRVLGNLIGTVLIFKIHRWWLTINMRFKFPSRFNWYISLSFAIPVQRKQKQLKFQRTAERSSLTLYAALSLVYSIRIPSLYGLVAREAMRHCTQLGTEFARCSHQQLVTKGQFSVKVNTLDLGSSTYIMGTMGWRGYWNSMPFSLNVVLCLRLQNSGV